LPDPAREHIAVAPPELVEQPHRSGRENLDADLTAFPATEVIGDSSDEAYREAERWLAADDAVEDGSPTAPP
jgi:hypothetical protein